MVHNKIRLVAFSLLRNVARKGTMIQFSEVESEQRSYLDFINYRNLISKHSFSHPNQPPLDLATHLGLLHQTAIAVNFLRSLRTNQCSAKKCKRTAAHNVPAGICFFVFLKTFEFGNKNWLDSYMFQFGW